MVLLVKFSASSTIYMQISRYKF